MDSDDPSNDDLLGLGGDAGELREQGRNSIHFKDVTKIITKNVTKNVMKNLSKSYNEKFKKSVALPLPSHSLHYHDLTF